MKLFWKICIWIYNYPIIFLNKETNLITMENNDLKILKSLRRQSQITQKQ